jgi:hypothetical protein
MSKLDDLVIIEEKPKRDQRKRKPKPYQPSRVWLILTGLLSVTFLSGICFFFIGASTTDYIAGDGWTATAIVATEQQVLDMATLTGNALLVSSETPTATVTPIVTIITPCTFNWASQDLPEVTAAAQAVFDQIETLRGVDVRANAYGETCGSNFYAMTTDFYLTVEQAVADDEAAMALVIAAVDVLTAPLGIDLPARLGYFDIRLTVGAEQQNLRFMFNEIATARAQGHTGAALLQALGGWR